MADLTIERFPEFFHALWGYSPFRWQERLAREVSSEGWPDAIDLPTASGKTAAMDVAVFTVAIQASLPAVERTAPRRIFFVVDRRVVVDQAFERAKMMATMLYASLQKNGSSGILRDVAEGLRLCAGPNLAPLGYARLRGGIAHLTPWTESPSQPAVVASTVDQIGSRLLFRGYGDRPYAWPIQAGLCGNDSLLLIDEAHSSVPFGQTTRWVKRYRGWSEEPVPTPFEVVLLSATPHLDQPEGEPPVRIFRLAAEERDDARLRERLQARKPAALVVAKDATMPRSGNRQDEEEARERLAGFLAQRAMDFLDSGRGRRIAVIVNRVATARSVRRELEEMLEGKAADLVLMTGRLRPLDREDLLETWGPRLRAGDFPAGDGEKPVVVVSTQSLEVGADFDFDVLVTEAASFDALRQRFGRLDRLGLRRMAPAVIVVAAYQEKTGAEDPIYGEALTKTWQELVATCKGRPSDSWGDLWPGIEEKDIKGVVDFGVEAIEERLGDEPRPELLTPVASAPVLLPAHVDRWAQTYPQPKPDPDPAVFLHGGDARPADVNLLWRLDLMPLESEEGGGFDPTDVAVERAIVEILSLCPPSSVETMPISLSWVRRWMKGWEGDVPGSESDLEGRGELDDPPRDEERGPRPVVVWRGRDRSFVTDRPGRLRPGDFVVILEKRAGAFGDFLRWSPGAEPVLDLGDRAQLLARGRPILRLHPRLLDNGALKLIRSEVRDELREFASAPMEEVSREEIKELLQRMLHALPTDLSPRDLWLRTTLQALLHRRQRFDIEPYPGDMPGFVLRGQRGSAAWIEADLKTGTEIDETGDDDEVDRWSESARDVRLEHHLMGVEAMAREIASRCPVPPAVVSDIALAAHFHDVGKADARFQAVLRGDSLVVPMSDGQLLAKARGFPTSLAGYRRRARLVRLPDGYRHELVSIRLVEQAADVLSKAQDPDLVLHLIASHHGRCRPFAPVVIDDDPVRVELEVDGTSMAAFSATGLERLGSGTGERYWRLVRRYGWWGLAYLEAILRVADHRRSAEESVA